MVLAGSIVELSDRRILQNNRSKRGRISAWMQHSMFTDDEFRKIIPNIDTIDPVGAIRARAKEIWKTEGSNQNVDLKVLFNRAESEILGGERNRAPTTRIKRMPEELSVDPELQSLVSDSSNLLRSIIVEAIKTRPDEHEAICLAYLLHSNAIVLNDQTRIEPQPVNIISSLLADIAGEYSASFMEQQKSNDFRSIAQRIRTEYWMKKITGIFEKDEALTFSSRHTIMRLVSMLNASRRVADVAFQG